jgi:hypothetical protein
MSTDTFLCGLIADLEAQIAAAMAAMADYAGDGIVSYTFNTGQTTQTVTKASLKDMQAYVDSLLARRDTLRQRCNLDTAAFNAAPGW